MTKFIQRIDADPYKFEVEIHLTKVEFNLVQQCNVSVTFKRGKVLILFPKL